MDSGVCREIVKKILDLKETDLLVYRELLRIGRARVKDIADSINRDRTTVQRSLNRLVRAGLCSKEKRILKSGGYFYVYYTSDPKKIRSLLEECLDRWYHKIKEKLKMETILV